MTEVIDAERLARGFQTVRETLLGLSEGGSHWTGELSASALSTATAVLAFWKLRERDGDLARLDRLIGLGTEWLLAHQNEDGGWGDTVKSVSNISTTMLCHATLHATAAEGPRSVAARERAQNYITTAGGVPALLKRYGKDRTFSVPILTHCALAGLVPWSQVPQLPFELAWFSPQFYKFLRLPVVSYALPALIAIGQVRHHFRPTRVLPWRWVRDTVREATLRRLLSLQPDSGGFLEATPLTSFVTMSLAGMGLGAHRVAQRGREFLEASMRPDGSWPIDTNLATWVTTLAVNALDGDVPRGLAEGCRDWLLGQQNLTVHPYTNADPGGWAWTDLTGGVPDADDTPGAILALAALEAKHPATDAPLIADRLHRAEKWLRDLQNSDGGWPTFCKGWGTLPFDRSSPDLTAHALRALGAIRRLEAGASANGSADNAQSIGRAVSAASCSDNARERGWRFLFQRQRTDGAWLPLWFGNQFAPDDENPTYGTSRVLLALSADESLRRRPEAARAVAWFRQTQNADGGWGGAPGTPSSTEETALALDGLLGFLAALIPGEQSDTTVETEESAIRGLNWLLTRVEQGIWLEPSPIGFYFAKLWYFEKMYPIAFTCSALRRAREWVRLRSPRGP